MSAKTQRYLLVINAGKDSANINARKIQQYQESLKTHDHRAATKIQWHLLYIMPSIPSYALRLPKLIRWAEFEQHRAQANLAKLGRQLGIPAEFQYLQTGSANIAAWIMARRLHITQVLGYGSFFTKLQLLMQGLLRLTKDTKKKMPQPSSATPWRQFMHWLSINAGSKI